MVANSNQDRHVGSFRQRTKPVKPFNLHRKCGRSDLTAARHRLSISESVFDLRLRTWTRWMVLKDAPFALAHLVHPREHSVQCRSLLLTSNQRTLRGSRFLLLQVMQGQFRARKYNAQKTFTWNQCATRHEHPVHREGSL